MKLSTDIVSITDDSRECDKNTLFLSDYNSCRYAHSAKTKCKKIIYPKDLKNYFKTDNIKIIGVTGTNGKTTTGALIYSLLLDLGKKVAFLGTRGFFINDKEIAKKTLTTPPLLELNYKIDQAQQEGCEFFIMEVSSHAIAQKRIEEISFALKIHTNITGDHLDFHKTFDEYKRVKNLFFADESPKLVNKDDKNIKFNYKNAMSYAIEGSATFKIEAYTTKDILAGVISFAKEKAVFKSSLVGFFNLYNILAAVSAVKMLTDEKLEAICEIVENFGGVRGRMEVVNKDPLVIVDFAHTHDGIKNALSSFEGKNIVVVFGAGGDRDKQKRAKMGQVASALSKRIYLTSDNPRTEDPQKIIDDILRGIDNKSKVIIEKERKKAIQKAIREQKKDEVLLILGKGDEEYQEINGKFLPFSDRDVILSSITCYTHPHA